jgi:hypothetical protein
LHSFVLFRSQTWMLNTKQIVLIIKFGQASSRYYLKDSHIAASNIPKFQLISIMNRTFMEKLAVFTLLVISQSYVVSSRENGYSKVFDDIGRYAIHFVAEEATNYTAAGTTPSLMSPSDMALNAMQEVSLNMILKSYEENSKTKLNSNDRDLLDVLRLEYYYVMLLQSLYHIIILNFSSSPWQACVYSYLLILPVNGIFVLGNISTQASPKPRSDFKFYCWTSRRCGCSAGRFFDFRISCSFVQLWQLWDDIHEK